MLRPDEAHRLCDIAVIAHRNRTVVEVQPTVIQ